MFNRGRNNVTDLVLLALFLILVYIFLSRHSHMSKVDTALEENDRLSKYTGHTNKNVGVQDINAPKLVPDKAVALTHEEKDQAAIDEKVAHIPDLRPSSCKLEPRGAEIPASLIIDFHDYSFYDMRVTISSIKRNTPDSLIREIIIVDDGSTLDYIIDEAKSYVEKLPKAFLLRNEDQKGQAASRMRAAKEAMGANLIFLDTNLVVSTGWIEPLVAYIQKEKNVIALPHHDKINDPVSYDYHKTDINVVTSFTWNLEVMMSRNKDAKDDEPFNSPVIRGNVFAVTKIYFNEIGGLDINLSDGGGDNLELSLRTWLCGGSVKVIPCSRIGILNYNEPVKITSNKGKWRIVQLWMNTHQDIVNKYTGKNLTEGITALERASLQNRKSDLAVLKCQSFTWYLDSIAKDVYSPPASTKQYGMLQVQNGRCARIGADHRIDLGNCNADQYKLLPRDMIFALTADGKVQTGTQCLSVQSSAYILAEDCKIGDDRQVWTYNNIKQLINKWSGFCIMHVTDPDPRKKEEKRQIAMAQKCEADTDKTLEFSSWKFIDV